MANISPHNLRSSKSTQNNQLNIKPKIQADQQSKLIAKIKAKSAIVLNKKAAISPHTPSINSINKNTSFESKLTKIESEIKSIKEIIDRRHEETTETIDLIRNEIIVKSINFEREIKKMNDDINRLTTSMMPTVLNENNDKFTEKKIDFAINGVTQMMYNMSILRDEIDAHLGNIYSAVERVDNDSVTNGIIVANLIESLAPSKSVQSTEPTISCGTNDKIDSIMNEIECLQFEFNKINILLTKDEEDLIKLNKQMHVLSAKYVQFNARINNHLLDCSRIMNADMSREILVDSDTLPFIADEKMGHKIASIEPKTVCKANKFASDESSDDRFGKQYNKYNYSKFIKVRLENTNIVNIDTFANEFKSNLMHVIGKQIVDKVTVTRFNNANGTVCNIDVVVAFNVPVSNQYLSAFKFPNNWNFFELNTHRYLGKQRQRHQYKHMRRMKNQNKTSSRLQAEPFNDK